MMYKGKARQRKKQVLTSSDMKARSGSSTIGESVPS